MESEAAIEATLREVVETLAALDRTPCSPGERSAAEWLHGRMSTIDGVEADLEDEPSWGTFPPTSVGLTLTGVLGAFLTLRGRRALGAPLADVWRGETVPGANDNLSGVACLVALAELLRERPIGGLRVLLVSCGAEETIQDGILAFMARHRGELDPAATRFVNLDTVGSPHLVLLDAEGLVRLEEYHGPWLRDLVQRRAGELGVALHRGYRFRVSTDSVVPSRAGYPTATLVSMTDWRAQANYHLPSDVPANLDYGTVADATRLVYTVAEALA